MKLSLSNPCPVRPSLTGVGDTTSACALCNKHVHHLTRMTEAEGTAVLQRAKTEDTCVRYVADRRGNVVFAPQLRRVAAAGLLAFAPVAFADGGDVVAQAQAEMNRLQDEMTTVGIDSQHLVIDDTAAVSNADHNRSQTKGTDATIDPDLFILYDGMAYQE